MKEHPVPDYVPTHRDDGKPMRISTSCDEDVGDTAAKPREHVGFGVTSKPDEPSGSSKTT